MARIGVLYGTETTFPTALVDAINARNQPGISGEHIRVGGVRVGADCGYSVIIDRVSHSIEFYRAFLRNALFQGTQVINDPFRVAAHDKFVHYAMAKRAGIPAPNTVAIPPKSHPPGTTVMALRNLEYPLNWEEIFEHVGFPAYLKPVGRGPWLSVQRVNSPEEFFNAYDQTGPTCMILQSAIPFTSYFRAYVIGNSVRVLRFDPGQPHHLRFVADDDTPDDLCETLHQHALDMNRAIGFDINAIDFAIHNDLHYMIDSFNPAPDADLHAVGQSNFDWIIGRVADLAIERAQNAKTPVAAAVALG